MHAHRIALAIGCLLLTAFSVSGRQIENWTYDRLFREANLVVIAAAEETITTEDRASKKDQDDTYVGQETAFQVRRILKGTVEGGVKLRVLHYRLQNGKFANNGPLFVLFRHDELELKGIINGIAFEMKLPAPDYLLFLRARPDGRYEPISGPVDPAVSVREVSSIDDFLLSKIAEISDKKPNKAVDSTATRVTPPAGQEAHAILKTLNTRDRNAVHVALWTLEQNGISNSPAISFDAPYSDAQPKIQAVRDYLNTLPEEKLSALDQRLAYHWQIYSPIWSSHDWP